MKNMSRLPFLIVGGFSAVLISCEPLPPNPPPGYRPNPRNFPYGGGNQPGNQPGYASGNQPRYGRDYSSGSRATEPGDRYGQGSENIERPPTREEYPVAERTDNPNQVLSPYAPYNVIDVEGFRSGQLAKDPSNGKIFRIP
jgi:hypothetical protein